MGGTPSNRLVVKEIGGFELVRELGQGGMGKVFLARQRSLDRLIALKVLQPGLASDLEFVTRFHREAKAAALFQHPNIAAVIDRGTDPRSGVHYIAFEYLGGGSLEDLIAREGPLSEEKTLRVARGIAHALRYAEGKGLVHRDVKPENILFDEQGVPKLADLGLARNYGRQDQKQVTQTGVVLGTPLYMAPEQALGEQDLDIRADIYALGLCLWRCLTNRVPFDEERQATSLQILSRHINQDLPDVRDRRKDVSEPMARLIHGMAARERDRRYGADELVRDLERVLAGEPLQGPGADPALAATMSVGPGEVLPGHKRLPSGEGPSARGTGKRRRGVAAAASGTGTLTRPGQTSRQTPARQTPARETARQTDRQKHESGTRLRRGPSPALVIGVLLGALALGIGLAVGQARRKQRTRDVEQPPSPASSETEAKTGPELVLELAKQIAAFRQQILTDVDAARKSFEQLHRGWAERPLPGWSAADRERRDDFLLLAEAVVRAAHAEGPEERKRQGQVVAERVGELLGPQAKHLLESSQVEARLADGERAEGTNAEPPLKQRLSEALDQIERLTPSDEPLERELERLVLDVYLTVALSRVQSLALVGIGRDLYAMGIEKPRLKELAEPCRELERLVQRLDRGILAEVSTASRQAIQQQAPLQLQDLVQRYQAFDKTLLARSMPHIRQTLAYVVGVYVAPDGGHAQSPAVAWAHARSQMEDDGWKLGEKLFVRARFRDQPRLGLRSALTYSPARQGKGVRSAGLILFLDAPPSDTLPLTLTVDGSFAVRIGAGDVWQHQPDEQYGRVVFQRMRGTRRRNRPPQDVEREAFEKFERRKGRLTRLKLRDGRLWPAASIVIFEQTGSFLVLRAFALGLDDEPEARPFYEAVFPKPQGSGQGSGPGSGQDGDEFAAFRLKDGVQDLVETATWFRPEPRR